ALPESTLLDSIRFQSGQQPRPAAASINRRIVVAERALRAEFPDAPCQFAPGFHQIHWRRAPMGIGRPRLALSRLRVRASKRSIVPLSVDEVARFWSSFRNGRDLAIVGLMLHQGLRSREILGSTATICCLRRHSFGCGEKATRSGFFHWLLNRFNCWITICGWSGLRLPQPPSWFLLRDQRAVNE